MTKIKDAIAVEKNKREEALQDKNKREQELEQELVELGFFKVKREAPQFITL